jgi:hypothetical protein
MVWMQEPSWCRGNDRYPDTVAQRGGRPAPLPPGCLDPVADRHLPIVPAAFRKLDAITVLAVPLLPAPLVERHAHGPRGVLEDFPGKALQGGRLGHGGVCDQILIHGGTSKLRAGIPVPEAAARSAWRHVASAAGAPPSIAGTCGGAGSSRPAAAAASVDARDAAAGSRAERTGHSGQRSCPQLEDMTELPCLYRTRVRSRSGEPGARAEEGDGPRSPA